MNETSAAAASRDPVRYVPAYGPVDALFGYALFYVVVDRATPTIAARVSAALSVSPSAVTTWLAIGLWVVLGLNVVVHLRRQLVALGALGADSARRRDSGEPPSERASLAYLVLVLVGGVIVAWSFESGLNAIVRLIDAVLTVSVDAITVGDLAFVIVFSVAFGVASYAADRLLVGGVRTLLEA